ncbi:MAG: sugar kinase [Anaerolineales bacterium]
MPDALDIIVLGNVTLDVLCYPVDDVPRHASLRFERSEIQPGGCGSNTAIGLAALGMHTALSACVGDDESAVLARRAWQRVGLDTRFVRAIPAAQTGLSVALVDRDLQPRFIHTPGANREVTVAALDTDAWHASGARFLHAAGFFLLEGLLTPDFGARLADLRARGWRVTLDVALSPNMAHPEPLWAALPYVDVLLCNQREARTLTGESAPQGAAATLKGRGVPAVVVKLGAQGCWLDSPDFQGRIPVPEPLPQVVDTTGAGDAFCAGFAAGLLRGESLPQACETGHRAAVRVVQRFGAVAGWMPQGGKPTRA